MRQKASFVFIDKPENAPYEVAGKRFLIGRSKKQADFAISGDPHISRVHAEVVCDDYGRFTIRNKGRNPVLVNGKAIDQCAIEDGDVVSLGLTEMKFVVGTDAGADAADAGADAADAGADAADAGADAADAGADMADAGADMADAGPPPVADGQAFPTVFDGEQTPSEEKTRVVEESAFDGSVPRLIGSDSSGQVKTFALNVDNLLIGRTLEADIRLNDPAVSHRHGAVCRKDGVFFIRNLDKKNPLQVNDRPVKHGKKAGVRLYAGDRIRLGESLLTFESLRPEDAAPAQPADAPGKSGGVAWAVAAVVLIAVLAAGGYFAYERLYLPYKETSAVDAVEKKAEKGLLHEARQDAGELLGTDLSPENRARTEKILQETSESIVEKLEDEGDIGQAEKFIESHLEQYGSLPGSQPLRDKIDEYAVRRAFDLESRGLIQDAIAHFSSVPGQSRYYQHAQSEIVRIENEVREKARLDAEKEARRQAEIADLLQKGQERFDEKKYLTPEDESAYLAYKAVLKLDPENQTALERMEQMKEFYRDLALKHYERGNCRSALTFLERFLVIDPDDRDIQEKHEVCRKRLGLR